MSNDLPFEAHLVALATLDEVGPARLRALLAHGSPAVVWQKLRARRLRPDDCGSGLSAERLGRWADQVATIDPAEAWRRCLAVGVGVTALGADTYPRRLAGDVDPPVVLFHRGRLDAVSPPLVAIVGTRRATPYGRRTAEALAADLTRAGIGIVSGLALGIDAAVHRGAVAEQGGPPVAVVGAGLDAPCPAPNRELCRQVAERGVVLSEVPVGVGAAPWRFPVRNRILAALADVVVVVESTVVGGSMHTVREALDRDRPVMAVPGPVDSAASEGTNGLLADGALVCTGAADVISVLGLAAPRSGPADAGVPPAADPRRPPDPTARAVLDELEVQPMSLDEVAARTGLGLNELFSVVGSLEHDGWIRRVGPLVERAARPGGPPRGER